MICKNCGGIFDKDELLCPYCGFENYEQAVDEQQDYIDDYKDKTMALKKEPKRIAKFSGKVILMIFVGIFAMFIVILYAASAIRGLSDGDKNLNKHKEDIEILEEYYNQKDYKELYDYMDKMDNRYSDSYEKYYIVYRMYDDYVFVDKQAADSAQLCSEYQFEDDGEIFVYYVYLCCDNLNKIIELRENGYVYGEEDIVEDFEQKFKDVMSNHLKMTDEEINEAINMYEGKTSTYENICKTIAKRMYNGGNK